MLREIAIAALVVAVAPSPTPAQVTPSTPPDIASPSPPPPPQTGMPPNATAATPAPPSDPAGQIEDFEAPSPPPPPIALPGPPPPAPPVSTQAPPPVPILCFTEGTICLTDERNVWSIGRSGVSVVVPAGFVTDFASIPWGFRNWFERQGRYSRAALIHDFLYWTQRCTRSQADNLFYIAMVESGVPWTSRNAIYQAVKLGGGSAWQQNMVDRRAGLGRVVPDSRRWYADDLTWPEARDRLRRERVGDPPMPVDARVCGIGDRPVVP